MNNEADIKTTSIRQDFIDHIKVMVRYWAGIPKDTVREQLEGLAFSILVMLDGESSLPPFSVRPIDDAGEEGEDIAGGLHDLFCVKS